MNSRDSYSCRVAMIGRWSKAMHLFGLNFSSSGVSLLKDSFACCGGSGVQITDFKSKTASICRLPERWALLSVFIQQFISAWGASDVNYFGTAQNDDILTTKTNECALHVLDIVLRDRLVHFVDGNRGQILEAGPMKKRVIAALSATFPQEMIDKVFPRIFWILGVVLTWHYGLVVLPFRFSQHKRMMNEQGGLLKTLPFNTWNQIIEKGLSARKIMLIDGVSELWHPHRLEQLDVLISFASERRIPIWILDESKDNLGSADSQKNLSEKNFRANVDKRIVQLRSKSCVHWLGGQSLSRLNEICDFGAVGRKSAEMPDIV